MARKTAAAPPVPFDEHIIDIDVTDEMQSSFLEYAYSVIYSRALPDARDGLKPVQRRSRAPPRRTLSRQPSPAPAPNPEPPWRR